MIDIAYYGNLDYHSNHDPYRPIEIHLVIISEDTCLDAEGPERFTHAGHHIDGCHLEIVLVVCDLVEMRLTIR